MQNQWRIQKFSLFVDVYLVIQKRQISEKGDITRSMTLPKCQRTAD